MKNLLKGYSCLEKNSMVHDLSVPCNRKILELKEDYARLIHGPYINTNKLSNGMRVFATFDVH